MDVIIVGAGGHGRVVLDTLLAAAEHSVRGFIDADETLAGTVVRDLPVFGHLNVLPRLRQQKIRGAIVAIGDNRVRQSYAAALVENGFELITAIHPRSIVFASAQVGRNTLVAAGAVVGSETHVGESCIINTAAVLDHEVRVGAATHVAPGALLAGKVRIGQGVFIGMGAKILPCLSVGDGATVGAGAVVRQDVPVGRTVVGVPARVL